MELTDSRTAQLTASEPRSLAAELHDGALQDLFSARLDVDEVLGCGDLPEPTRELMVRIARRLAEGSDRIRSLICDLHHDGAEDQGGLVERARVEADSWSAASGIPVDLRADIGAQDPSSPIGALLLRTVREGLANVYRHANASQAQVGLRRAAGRWEVVVDDDGTGGLPPPPIPEVTPESFGLGSLAHEAGRLGGLLRVGRSRPLGGFQLRVAVPDHVVQAGR